MEKLALLEQRLDLFVEIREYILDNDDVDKKKFLRDSEKLIEKERKLVRIEKKRKAEQDALLKQKMKTD